MSDLKCPLKTKPDWDFEDYKGWTVMFGAREEGQITWRSPKNAWSAYANDVQTYHPTQNKAMEELKSRFADCQGERPSFENIVGKWPGDETDEEIRKMLEEIS